MNSKRQLRRCLWVVQRTLAVLLLLSAAGWGGAPVQAAPGWRDTGLVLPPTTGLACFDAQWPGQLLVAYWQQHGGLAIHGYPISEEFAEVSPTDGHTYVVQYFQRSRFEWHPENQGTPYEVLLGLLGNRLLEVQGWR